MCRPGRDYHSIQSRDADGDARNRQSVGQFLAQEITHRPDQYPAHHGVESEISDAGGENLQTLKSG